jgi:2-phospho-L-lactate/phosphoenolpyruvate guanylyltransferase
MRSGWCLVVPVKRLALAKSRLGDASREPGHVRREALALAFAADTVAAALHSDEVAALYVVTDDPVAGPVLARIGATVLADRPNAGLNPALGYGARVAARRRPGHGIAALSADLPALRPAELSLALALASSHRSAVVPDAAGSGTTLYAARAPSVFAPAYGPDSLGKHVAGGARVIDVPGLDSVRCDVDTSEDLAAAVRLGVGPHTTEALRHAGRLRHG